MNCSPPRSLLVRLVFFTPLLFSLVACAPGPEARMEDYLVRLGRVLVLEIPPASAATSARAPVRENAQPLPELSIDLLDFFKIQHCQFGRTLANKNNQMGKFAPTSQRMHTERDLLLQGPACVAELQAEQSPLAAELAAALETKQRYRMATWWNAWFTSEEWRAATSLAALPLAVPATPADVPGHLSLTLAALEYAQQQGQAWGAGQLAYDETKMENHLQQLKQGQSIGGWQRSLALAEGALRRATTMLAAPGLGKQLCPMGSATSRSEILNNVLVNIYGQRVQPYLVQLDRFGDELLPVLEMLVNLAPESHALAQWLLLLEQEKAGFDVANLAHVKAWQGLLEQCGQRPGG